MVGGAAIFDDKVINHHIAMAGEININPLLITRFRE